MEKFKEIIDFIRKLYNQPEGFIPLHAPVFNGNEKKYLNDCIDSSFVSSVGKYVDLFEEKMAEYTGATKAVVCVNGTNALHLALKLVGVEENTEVITQPLTFIATANAISYTGAQCVFLDVDRDTMGLSPTKLNAWLERNEKLETRNTELGTQVKPINKLTNKQITACVPMHTFGHPCRIDEIVEICKQYNIPVIEDAAESLGSFYKNQHTGTFGEIGVLSFNGNKILTSGGGGMLLFKDEKLAQKAKHLTTQAKVPHPWEFVHDEIGYNYRMPNINAALGLAQLEQLPQFLESKRIIAQKYAHFFSACHPEPAYPVGRPVEESSLSYFTEPKYAKSNFWLNTILLNNKAERNLFLKFTNKNGIMTRPAWTLMNKLNMFKNCISGDLTNANWLADRIVNIPSSVTL
jgi:perosamine synthetase